MSYVVIRSDSPGNSTFEEFVELEDAVEHLEKTCTGAGSAGARLCRLEPVDFEVKRYFKVEIPAAPTSPVGPMADVRSLEPAPAISRSPVPGESRRGLFGR